MRPPTRRRGCGGLAALALALCLPAAARARSAPPDSAEDVASLSEDIRENDALERLAALAATSDFYLVLEPDSSALTLRLQGAKLRRFPVETVEIVRPALAFLPRHELRDAEAAAWLDRTWHDGELDPVRTRDRIEIQALPPDPNRPEGSVEIPVPPTAEESISVPARYFIRFADHLVLEIDATRAGVRSSATWKDRLAAGGLHPADPWRLRVRLSAADADLLYRSLPPAVALLVWPSRAAIRP